MRRLVVASIALALGATLAVVPTPWSPAQVAHALCVSTVSPTCNPGNIPILVQAGVIAAPRAGAAVVPAAAPPATASTGLVLDLSIVGAATLAVAGFLGISMPVGDGYRGRAALHQNGLGKLEIDTDPEFSTPAYVSLPLAFGGGSSGCTGWFGNATPTPDTGELGMTCDNQNPRNMVRPGNGSNWRVDYLSDRVTVTAIDGHIGAGVNSVRVVGYCGLVKSSQDFGGTSWPVGGGYSVIHGGATCSNGQPVDRVLLTGRFFPSPNTGSSASATIWAAEAVSSGLIEGVSTASVDCKGPGGVQTITASEPYSVTPGQSITTPEVVCPPGTIAVGAGLTVDQGGTTTDIIPRDDNDVTPRISELVDLLPHCFGPAAVPCPMVLQRLDSGEWQDCGPNGSYCPTWAATPEPQLQALYRCLVGGVVVDIRYCSAYRAPLVGVLPNVGPDGELLHPSAPAPVAGDLYSPTPPGGGPSTGAPPGWLELIDLDRPDPSNCFPTGWGMLNPLSWVLQPVQCALSAAFVPTVTMQTALATRVDAVFADTAFSVVTDVLPTLGGSFSGAGSGCQGPPWRIAAFGIDETFYPFNACSEPVAGAAAMVRTMLTVTIVFLTVFAAMRYIAASIGYVSFGSSAGTTRAASSSARDD